MKKSISVFIALLSALLLTVLPVAAFTPVGDIEVPFGTPTIDGTLAQGEWSELRKIVVNAESATASGWVGEVPADFTIDFFYTWDESFLYFAGKVTDSTFAYSESGGNYNGDAFQLSLNVGQVFKSADYDRAVFYSFGCLEDGTVDINVQESLINDGVIDDCGFSHKTDKGWEFEFKLPWETLVLHVLDKSDVNVSAAAGFKVDALICYIDRDSTGGAPINAFYTTKVEPGGWDPDSFGITLTLAAKPEPVVEAPAVVEAPVVEEPVVEAPVVAETPAAVETPVVAAEPVTVVVSAAQTFDAVGITLAIAALASAVMIKSKKR